METPTTPHSDPERLGSGDTVIERKNIQAMDANQCRVYLIQLEVKRGKYQRLCDGLDHGTKHTLLSAYEKIVTDLEEETKRRLDQLNEPIRSTPYRDQTHSGQPDEG
ncbi:MAG: hypothetical protein [Siphoviridae sp. ctvD11]|nr:MAG: hypothetical protein [Siphoviridae sp. ctvD11]